MHDFPNSYEMIYTWQTFFMLMLFEWICIELQPLPIRPKQTSLSFLDIQPSMMRCPSNLYSNNQNASPSVGSL